MGLREHSKSSCWSQALAAFISLNTTVCRVFREMDQDHSLVKKLNISIDLVVYNTIIIDKIRVASSPLVDNFLVTDRESDS